MSRIPPLRKLGLHRAVSPTGRHKQMMEPMLESALETMPDDIDQWLETAFDPSVELDELMVPLAGAAPHSVAGAE